MRRWRGGSEEVAWGSKEVLLQPKAGTHPEHHALVSFAVPGIHLLQPVRNGCKLGGQALVCTNAADQLACEVVNENRRGCWMLPTHQQMAGRQHVSS